MRMMDGAGTTESKQTAGGGLTEIGAMLRRRREEVGRDLATISAITHIKTHYLKAIEEGRRKDLPGTAYMIGYIRTYANYLGLDGNRLISDYHADLAGQHRWVDTRADPVEPAMSQFQISPAIALAGLLILGVAGYVGWGYVTAPREAPADTETVETQPPLTPPDAEPEPPTPASSPTSQSPTGAEASAPVDRPPANAAVTSEPAVPAEQAAAPAAEDQVPPEADVANTGEEPVVEESPPQPEAAAGPDATAGKIVVRARLESWIQVTNAKNEIVFSRVLRAGETYTVPDEQGLMFTTGNAGGVDILVDGRKLKSLGTVGLVKRDIPLDARKLVDGSAFIRPAPAAN
jgi:cytoskeleton protein RodZ